MSGTGTGKHATHSFRLHSMLSEARNYESELLAVISGTDVKQNLLPNDEGMSETDNVTQKGGCSNFLNILPNKLYSKCHI